jgi:hypothetical protein
MRIHYGDVTILFVLLRIAGVKSLKTILHACYTPKSPRLRFRVAPERLRKVTVFGEFLFLSARRVTWPAPSTPIFNAFPRLPWHDEA